MDEAEYNQIIFKHFGRYNPVPDQEKRLASKIRTLERDNEELKDYVKEINDCIQRTDHRRDRQGLREERAETERISGIHQRTIDDLKN